LIFVTNLVFPHGEISKCEFEKDYFFCFGKSSSKLAAFGRLLNLYCKSMNQQPKQGYFIKNTYLDFHMRRILFLKKHQACSLQLMANGFSNFAKITIKTLPT